MMADGSAAFAQATGLTLDLTARGMGLRSQRYSMLVDDGVVKSLNVEGAGQVRGQRCRDAAGSGQALAETTRALHLPEHLTQVADNLRLRRERRLPSAAASPNSSGALGSRCNSESAPPHGTKTDRWPPMMRRRAGQVGDRT